MSMWGKPKEWLPWYRAHDYEGNLTEAEKRQLDAFRVQPKHPAAELDDLPEEVQNYINTIECELHDEKNAVVFARALFFSAIGAALIFLNYKGFWGAPTIWQYAGAEGTLALRLWLGVLHWVLLPSCYLTTALSGPQTYGWAQVQNIKRDPFEQAVGEEQKSVLSIGGTLASASTAYIYNWNMLPTGQQLWLKELSSYIDFPPLQDPESYNLTQVLEQVKKLGAKNPSR
jgi:hypothetical protein